MIFPKNSVSSSSKKSYSLEKPNLFKLKYTQKFTMNKWLELLLGLILVIGAILVAWYSSVYSCRLWGIGFNFLSPAWAFFKGGLIWFVIMIGLLFIMLGISDLKE